VEKNFTGKLKIQQLNLTKVRGADLHVMAMVSMLELNN
jgi:hypothetical protein